MYEFFKKVNICDMQQIAVIITLVLYTVFSMTPLAGISMFSRTLNIAPGDLVMVFIGLSIIIEQLVKKRSNKASQFRAPNIVHFLYSYIALAAVFLAPTILFFMLRNEYATYMPRNVYVFFLWLIPIILFYYSTAKSIRFVEAKRILNLLMVSFLAGVIGNMWSVAPGFGLIEMVLSSLTSPVSRLSGQIEDPNQLGTVAVFFAVFAILGLIKEPKFRQRTFFVVFAIASCFVLLLTQSRESMVTLFVSMISLCVLLVRERRLLPAFFLAILLFVVALTSLWFVPRIAETITAVRLGETGDALSARDTVWKTSLDIITSNPLGIGFETMYLISAGSAHQAHNAFLQATVVAGGLGFLAYLAFLYYLIKLLWTLRCEQRFNWLLDAYIVFLSGYLITAMWSDHFISFFTFNSIYFGYLGFVVRSNKDGEALNA